MLVVRHLCLLPLFSFKPPNGNDSKRLAEFDIFMEPAWKQWKKNQVNLSLCYRLKIIV